MCRIIGEVLQTDVLSFEQVVTKVTHWWSGSSALCLQQGERLFCVIHTLSVIKAVRKGDRRQWGWLSSCASTASFSLPVIPPPSIKWTGPFGSQNMITLVLPVQKDLKEFAKSCYIEWQWNRKRCSALQKKVYKILMWRQTAAFFFSIRNISFFPFSFLY